MGALRRGLVEASVVFAISVALFAALEAGLRAAQAVDQWLFPRDSVPLVERQPWGAQYLADQKLLQTRHDDYVEFRERPLASKTINVDGEGIRVTPGSCAAGTGRRSRILLFGGSTMFGYGVPDAFTIPAYVARALNRPGTCVEVVNYGAGWWQSTQSVMQLLRVLQQGTRPDAVVFYDGVNDVAIAMRGGDPGRIAPEAEALLKNALDDGAEWGRLARSSALVRFAAKRLRRSEPEGASAPSFDAQAQAAKVADIYVRNVRAVEALGKEYGFNAYFFLQPFPLIAGKVHTEPEDAVIRGWTRGHERDVAFLRMAYDRLRDAPGLKERRFHDISRMFDGMTGELYADTQHLLPEGNRLVAERILKELRIPQ